MGLLVNKTDFVGKYAIPQNYLTNNIDSYISKYEEKYLKELMGVELFKLFKADISVLTPVTTIYLAIYNPIEEDDTCLVAYYNMGYAYSQANGIRISDGIKEMLIGFIYFEFIRDSKYKNTPTGTVTGQSENSRETSFNDNGIYNRYNEAVNSYKTIQWFIMKNKADYPKFNGVYKAKAYWL